MSPLPPQLYKISGQQNLLSSLIILFHCLLPPGNDDQNNFSFSFLHQQESSSYSLVTRGLSWARENEWLWMSQLDSPKLPSIKSNLQRTQTNSERPANTSTFQSRVDKNDLKIDIFNIVQFSSDGKRQKWVNFNGSRLDNWNEWRACI